MTRATCFVEGRWASRFALGEVRPFCERINAATSEALQAFYLKAIAGTFQHVKSFEVRVKARLTSTIAGKAAYHEHLPQLLGGVFAQFQGATEAQSKDCLRRCIQEYDSIEDLNFQHTRSNRLLRKDSANRAMVEHYLASTDDLQDHVSIFV